MREPDRENWSSGTAYEQYVGRWSRKVAVRFIDWLEVPPGLAWTDVGCGTGALSACILDRSNAATLRGVDRSEAYVAEARAGIQDPRATFEVGDAGALPWSARSCDVTVCGLVLNFVRDAGAMVNEMQRVTRPGGKVAAYVWDYAGGMQMMRHFWDVAIALSPADSKLDQAERFPLCRPEPLKALFTRAGLASVAAWAVQGGVAPAP
jgi:trans-aconitate methyltransferase